MHFEVCLLFIGCGSTHIVLVMCGFFLSWKINNYGQKSRSQYVHSLKGTKTEKKSWKPGNNFPKKSEICFYFFSQYIYNRWKWSWYSLHERGFLFFRGKKSLSFYASIHSNFNFFLRKSNVKLLNEHMNERKTAYCFKNWPLMNTCWDLCECTWKWKKKEGKKCVRLSGCVVNIIRLKFGVHCYYFWEFESPTSQK